MARASILVALTVHAVLLAPSFGLAQGPSPEWKKVDQPESLHKAIAEAIVLVNEKKSGEFMERFVPWTAQMLKNAEIWEDFKKKAYDRDMKYLIEPLKEVESQQVELSPDGREAIFGLSTPNAEVGQKLGFEKIGDRWVLYRRERDLKRGEKRVDQPAGLRRSVAKCAASLEAKNPDDFAKMVVPVERAEGATLLRGRTPAVLKVLKELQLSSEKVILSADGNTATFELTAESPTHTMTFKKVDGAWYFSGKIGMWYLPDRD